MSSPLQLVATLGPRSMHLVDDLVREGVTTFRFNGSHLSAEELRSSIDRVRQTQPTFPLLVDLQGAKMRLGRFPEHPLTQGARVKLSLEPGPGEIPLPHEELFRSLKQGETLSCDDDRVRLKVLHCEGDAIEAECLTGQVLRARKGVNVLEHPVELEDLGRTDIEQIEVAKTKGPMAFACSFMKDGREADWIRKRAPSCPVIGKVERREATDAVQKIAEKVDEIWICRGDLGAQIGLVELAKWVGAFDPKSVKKPTLMAGQVFEHLTGHKNPTRSEVCHLYDLLCRGYQGIVLSDETAIGADPVGTVRQVVSLLKGLA